MRVYNIHSFPDGALEYISKIIGEKLTVAEISMFLKNVGYSDVSIVVGTKWKFIYNVFKNIKKDELGCSKLLNIIQLFCDPTRWIGRESEYLNTIDQINEALQFINFQIDTKGNLIYTDKKITFVEKQKMEVFPESQEMIVNPVFRERNIELAKTLCFVLMPFEPSFDRLYKNTIKTTVEHCGFRCRRADDIFSSKPIIEDIWIQICKSKVIIADVTGKNPNVFYEIGIAHTIGRPVIFITQNQKDIPFDVKHYRYIVYSDDDNGWKNLDKNLRFALTPLISRNHK
jgi:hypothetical protein